MFSVPFGDTLFANPPVKYFLVGEVGVLVHVAVFP